MFKYLVSAGVLFLFAHFTNAQHACCSGSAANVVLGTESSSVVAEKGKLTAELGGFHWSFRSQDLPLFFSSSVADVKYVNVATTSLYYGLTNSITLSLTQPYLHIVSDVYSYNAEDVLEMAPYSNHGLGDMAVTGTWQISLGKAGPQLGLLTGVELPTGFRDINTSAITTSIGSGSFDPMAGLLATQQLGRFGLRGSGTYKLTTVNELGIDYGDFANGKLSVRYALNKNACLPDSLLDTQWTQSVFAGVSHDRLFRQTREGEPRLNTSYRRTYVQAGMAFGYGKKIRFNISGELPIRERISGLQNRTKFRVRSSFASTF